MNKAIIVEVNKRHVIVLAEGGEFKKIKNTNAAYMVGQEIRLPVKQENKKTAFSIFNWKTGTAVALAIFLLFFQVLAPISGPGAYAYVGINMDPSLELKIDEDMKVLDIFAYNQQGHMVLDRLNDWENEKIEHVTDLIFETCEDLGYLKSKEEVLITTTLSEEIPADKEKEIKQQVNKVMTEKAKKNSIEMTTIVMSSKEREQSKKMKMSPGHYAIYKAAKKSGKNITKNEISSLTIEEISEKVGPIKELLKEEIETVEASDRKKVDLVYEPPLPILDIKDSSNEVKFEKEILPVQEKVQEPQQKKTFELPVSHAEIPSSPKKEEKPAEKPVKIEPEKHVNTPAPSAGEQDKNTHKTPTKSVPVVTAPKEERPKQDKPVEDKPKQELPKEEKPKPEVPKENIPKEAPKEDKPKVETPKEETPKVETPKEETPKEETPKEETPKEETPKEETPKEETPKEETPKEETPKEETPKEETPKEETPKEHWIYIEIIIDGIVIEVRIKVTSNVTDAELKQKALATYHQNVSKEHSCPTPTSAFTQEVEQAEASKAPQQTVENEEASDSPIEEPLLEEAS
ncbi:anti-sigma-I factor RsgI family protein [Fictibacillus sp. 18YEL24]|uniref:anti-sigma-I factor RsgI family protein n=1 Tax=Fictibacillus sp. 18YEL24 TaxID=2745875 RepID=UPI0018CD78A2|nr:anti-sigma factor domain-containing protein [Fictibacillus sp. 18YEL24]MBH0171084.1 anti-sigma factor domain-containing protein [Fictibacillus sp. 18YEL24]